jgi:4-hydroxy-3-methylbut-2-en-1-yl diphosphate synthase IspG/GcpE
MGEGFFKKFLVSFLASRPTELVRAISDCKLFTKLVVEGLTEAMVKWLQQSTGVTGGLADVLRNTIGATIRDSKSFKQNIEQEFAGTICSLFEKYTSNAKNVLTNVTKTETPTPTTN